MSDPRARDVYPRYTVTRPIKFSSEVERIAYRVSYKRAHVVAAIEPLARIRAVERPRFRIKVATYTTDRPIVLSDARRPVNVRSFYDLEAAMRYVDNLVRAERGMPRRDAGPTREEILAAMAQRRANVEAGTVPHSAPVRLLPAEYVEEGVNR